MNNTWVIYSPNESAINDGRGYWSTIQKRWVEVEEATQFTESQKYAFGELPLAIGSDAVWTISPEGAPLVS